MFGFFIHEILNTIGITKGKTKGLFLKKTEKPGTRFVTMSFKNTRTAFYKNPVSLSSALQLLREGDVVALPTETVYGLAGRMDSQTALEKIFHIKKRPFFDPLIVHCCDKRQALQYTAEAPPLAERLWDLFSPGPLTLVLRKNAKVPSVVTAGQETVALRIPRHPLFRRILKDLKVPVAAPSANLFGCVSPTRADHVLTAFNGKVPVLDGGVCEEGLESTIVRPQARRLIILREGSLPGEEIQKALKAKNIPCALSRKTSPFIPGGGKSHYAPAIPLYIVENPSGKNTEDFLSKKFPGRSIKHLKLHSRPEIAARRLYHDLRALSQDKNALICVQKTGQTTAGLWRAIWDRLEKAASGKLKV